MQISKFVFLLFQFIISLESIWQKKFPSKKVLVFLILNLTVHPLFASCMRYRRRLPCYYLSGSNYHLVACESIGEGIPLANQHFSWSSSNQPGKFWKKSAGKRWRRKKSYLGLFKPKKSVITLDLCKRRMNGNLS